MTFSRRPGERFNRGRIQQQPPSGAAPAVTPLTIITSVPVLQWIRADLNVALNAGNVSAILDQTSNHYDFAQGTAVAQALYTAADATLNNQATITGDGVNDTLLNSTMPNGAGNWMSGIVKTVTWVNNKMCWGSNAAPECGDLYSASVSPKLAQYSGVVVTNLNAALSVGTWGRAEAYYANSVAAYLKLISTKISGTSPGVNTSTGCALFSTVGIAFGNFAIAERVVCSGLPTPGEIDALDAYYTARYGVGLV